MPGWPTRVLIAAEAGGGGLTHDLDLARGLRARGVEVVLAAPGAEPTALERATAEALGVWLEHAPLSLEWIGDGWRDGAAASAWLAELESRHRCDLVHLDGVALAPARVSSGKIVAVRACALSWWESVRGEPAPPEWGRYQTAVSEGLASASHVVSPTRWMRQTVERHYGAPARSSVIHDARPPGSFEPTGKQPFVLGAGRVWDEAKNLPSLARAGRSLPWPVKIAGPIAPAAAGAAASLDAFEGVDLLGALSTTELADLYARASIFAAPARYDPSGLSVLEAALSGCALVLGDIPSLRELWDDAAVFVPPEEIDGLSACLHDLVRHPELRHEMGVEAQARAAAYRFDDMVDAYLRVYATALGAPASPSSHDLATEAQP
ncbi:MAG TPA: glycosyltransferase family 4 protein [Polyangia bacterium]|nr:glycosyltransferase family 4 protein [Polyangia bacterium]